MDADVLVVGAGPVGLLLAAELALAGVRSLVVERLAEPSTETKARGIGALAAEALRRRGLGEALAAHRERGLADLRRDHGTERAHFAHLHKLDLVPPGEPTRERALIWQPELERLLAEHTAVLGVTVLRGAPLTAITVRDDSVLAAVGGRTLTASYLVGCDGGRSTVRGLAGFEFPGTDPYLVVRAGDVELADAAALPTAGRLPTGDLMHRLPRAGSGSYAGLLGVQELASASPPPTERMPLTAGELADAVRRVAGVQLALTLRGGGRRFSDHARQAARYRLGRVLLAGDAAHVHSPNGGQGLDLGLMDAVNLGWKLAATVRGEAPGALLDSYSAERHPVAAAVLHNTRAQSALLTPGPHTDALRDIVSDLMDIPAVNAYFAELLTGLHGRYPLPYHPDLASDTSLGQHLADFTVHTATATTTAYELARDGRPLLIHCAGPVAARAVTDAAAPWADRLHAVEAEKLGRDDLSAALVRPDGVLAWAAGPTGSDPGTGLLRGALRCWLGPEPGVPGG